MFNTGFDNLARQALSNFDGFLVKAHMGKNNARPEPGLMAAGVQRYGSVERAHSGAMLESSGWG